MGLAQKTRWLQLKMTSKITKSDLPFDEEATLLSQIFEYLKNRMKNVAIAEEAKHG